MRNKILKFNDIGKTILSYDRIISLKLVEKSSFHFTVLFLNIIYFLNGEKFDLNIEYGGKNKERENDYKQILRLMEEY